MILRSSLFVLHLETCWFQLQSQFFLHSKHNIHILHRLSHSTLQKVVDAGSDEELRAVLLAVDKTLVGVDHLLEVDRLVDVMGEGREVFTTSVAKMPRAKSPR